MFNRIREYFARSKSSQIMANIIDPWQAGRPLAEVWDVKRFAEEGYRRNSLIFACIVMKMTSFSQPELKVRINAGKDERELPPGHVLNGILGSGLLAGYQKTGVVAIGSQTAFMRAWSMHLDVAGNAYAFIVRNGSGMPLQVKLLTRPDMLRPVPDANGDIWEYEYGKTPNVQHIPAGDLIHEQANPDPLDPYRGLSPIAVLARMGDLDNYAADYLRAFFLNAGIPALMAKFKQQTEKPIRERFKEQWKERYSGVHGWHDLFVTDTDIDIEVVGSKVQTMNLESIFGETESRICGTFGVHPILVAAWIGLQRSTMANYEQARRSLYQDTLLPTWVSTGDRFTTDLAAEFGDNIVCEFDLDDVPELQKDKTDEKKLALEGWNASLLTRNEAREVWQLDPLDNGDVFKVGAADSFESVDDIPGESGMQDAVEPEAIPAVLPAAAATEEPQATIHSHESLRLVGGLEQHDAAQVKALQRIADAGSPALKKVLKALISLNGNLGEQTIGEIAAMLARGDMAGAMAAIPWQKLQALELDLIPEFKQIIDKAGTAAAKGLTKDLWSSAQHSSVRTEYEIHGVGFVFDRTDANVFTWIKGHTAELVNKAIMPNSQQAIRDIIGRAFSEGIPPRKAAYMIKSEIGLLPKHAVAVEKYYAKLLGEGRSEAQAARMRDKYANRLLNYRSRNIARTESINASAFGQQACWDQAVADGTLDPAEWERVWIADETERTCELCQALAHGGPAPWGQPYPNSGGVMRPTAHPSCLPGTMRVMAGGIVATSKRWFDGDIIILHTAGGKQLSTTPNHPIASDRGWVAAERLNIGDSVICSCLGNWDAPEIGDNENVPTMIHEVAEAFRCSSKVSPLPVPVAAEDFHGDGEGSKVAVIWANGLLGDSGDAASGEHGSEIGFHGADSKQEFLPSGRTAAFLGKGLFSLASGFMRGCDLGIALFRGHLSPLQPLRLALVSGFDAGAKQLTPDGGSRNVEVFGNGRLGHAAEVQAANLINWQAGAVGLRSHFDAQLFESEINKALADAQLFGNGRASATSKVTLDQITVINRTPFKGHVYNLQTELGLYVAEGIITSNCRCVEGLQKKKAAIIEPKPIKPVVKPPVVPPLPVIAQPLPPAPVVPVKQPWDMTGPEMRATLAEIAAENEAAMNAANELVVNATLAIKEKEDALHQLTSMGKGASAKAGKLRAELAALDNQRFNASTKAIQIQDAKRAAMSKAIRADIPSTVQIKITPSAESIEPNIASKVDEFKRVLGFGTDKLDGFNVTITDIGAYSGRSKIYGDRSFQWHGDIYLGSKSSPPTLWHELGHVIEERSLSARQKVIAFLQKRTAGDPLVRMRDLYPQDNYDATELTKVDQWDKLKMLLLHPEYAGKDYSGHATEILSRGMEALYINSALFAKLDPEYFDLIWGIIRGLP